MTRPFVTILVLWPICASPAQYSKFKQSLRNLLSVMFDIVFNVKVEAEPDEVVKVVGCLAELGAWKPQKALVLVFKKGGWESAKIKVLQDHKFEFKIIKEKGNGVVQWETLPNNSNRKFKPKYSSKLQLTWSCPQGKISTLNRNSIKIHGLPGAMMVAQRQKSLKTKREQQEFDPYEKAHDQNSESSQQQQDFNLLKRKMSDQITINAADLQEIYYNSTDIQIYWDLFKKLKLYVISNETEINSPFLEYVEQQLKELPGTCLVKWISDDCLVSCEKKHSSFRRLKKRASMFEVKEEELQIESLYSRTSYFMFLEIETAIKFQGKTGNVPTCLFLPSAKYNEAISLLPYMSNLQLICFDEPSTNKAYYEYLREQQQNSSGGEAEAFNRLQITNPSINEIIEALKELKHREPVILNTLGNIQQAQALKKIESPNTVTIIDAHLAQNYPYFAEKIIEKLDHHSLLIIVSQGDPSTEILVHRQHKNIAYIYNNFQKIILEGKQYHPLRKCKETLDLLKMKVKLYQETHGGEVVEKIGSLIYNIPANKLEHALRIQAEFNTLVGKYNFIRVSLKGLRLKINWSLATQVRILRTVCEIKYTNYGLLGDFNIISDRLSLRELKDGLRLLIQRCSKLFSAKHQTKVCYFSYGDCQAATCHILPQTSDQP